MSNPLQPTRQQLDELEALMQRMLALPVNQLDAGADDELSLPTLAPIDMPPAWDTAESALLPAEGARPSREPIGPVKNGDASRPTVPVLKNESPPVPPPISLVRDDPVLAAFEEPEEGHGENLTPVAANVAIVRRSAAADRPWSLPARARSAPLRPLLWTNRVFDRTIGAIGAPGRWLRSPRGRAWIGWTGLALLAAAATWAFLEWMGWTW